MRQIMFLFLVALVFVSSVCIQSRQAMAQEGVRGIPTLQIFRAITTAVDEKLEVIGEFDRPIDGFMGESVVQTMKLVTAIIKPFKLDEVACSLIVPVDVPIGQDKSLYLKIGRNAGEFWINDMSTPLPECLIGGRAILKVSVRIPANHVDDVYDPSKLADLPKSLGLDKLALSAFILDANDKTAASVKLLGSDGTFLSVHNIHVDFY